LEKALADIPRLLGLIDRNPTSATYGCFDRNYWHYKTVDFPTGMAQLGVLALAYVYSHKFKNNPYYKQPRIRELVLAGLRYLPKCSHKDGSADEFYPYERALGATAFPLIAATEAYLLLKEHHSDIVLFFRKRAEWLAKNTEPAVIANHQAGAALALANLWLITRDEKYLLAAQKKISHTLAWFNDEGWFQEYEGCDPGYLTFTIDYLAKYYKKTGDTVVLPVLEKAVRFCTYFMHPDGSFAGEYGSRNTGHFLPDGFEILGKHFPEALALVDRYSIGLANGRQEWMNDEKYFFYNQNNYFQTYLDWNTNRPGPLLHKNDFEKYFPRANLYVCKHKNWYVVCSLAKGGVLKVFRKDKLVYQDTGILAQLDNGMVIASQVIDADYRTTLIPHNISVVGQFHSINRETATPFKMMLFRSLLLLLARFPKLGTLTKHLLVKRLITRKRHEPAWFKREIRIDNTVTVRTTLKLTGRRLVKRLFHTSDAAIIHVPTSRYFQEGSFFPWEGLQDEARELNRKGRIVIERVIN
jgi:hypothetical protein